MQNRKPACISCQAGFCCYPNELSPTLYISTSWAANAYSVASNALTGTDCRGHFSSGFFDLQALFCTKTHMQFWPLSSDVQGVPTRSYCITTCHRKFFYRRLGRCKFEFEDLWRMPSPLPVPADN